MVGMATRNTSDKDIKIADLYNPAQEQANKALELTAFSVRERGRFHAPCTIPARAMVSGGSSAGALARYVKHPYEEPQPKWYSLICTR